MPGITVFASKNIMSRFPKKVREKAVKSLTRRGINLLEHSYVREIKPRQVILDSGKVYHMDAVFLALGINPSPIFQKSGLPTGPDGGLLVNKYLQCTDYPEVFGGGDCIYFKDQPLDKVGVYAVRQNPVLFQNLLASLEGSSLTPFNPGGDYMLVFNMGDGTGILRKKWIVFGGRPAFIIKDYIDRKFIKKYQAIE
jgi:NADH dehydrogenase FAD-containing subunit